MKITHVHGITDTAYKMLTKGEDKPVGPWMCSDHCGMSYLWSAEKNLGEVNDDPEEITEYIIRRGRESAILQCPIFEDEVFHVLLLDIPSDYEGIEDDFSCENMDSSADCIPQSDLKCFIVGVKSYKLSKYFHPFIMAGVLNNDHFNESVYPNAIIQCARALKGAEWEYEMIDDNIQEI